MSTCKVCKKDHSKFLMNNKAVCFSCDELLFDIEIECEETPRDVQFTQTRTEKEIEAFKTN